MEEFDFDLNADMGTSVSQLRSRGNYNEPNENTHTEDFDYDKVMEHFNSEQSSSGFNYDTNRDTMISTMSTTLATDKQPTEMFTNTSQPTNIPQYVPEHRPKKQQNMNRFVRDLETNLDNFGKVNLNEPLPVNFTRPMIAKSVQNLQKQKHIEQMGNTNNGSNTQAGAKTKQEKILEQPKDDSIMGQVKNFFNKIEFREIIICMLLFMVLNNKIVIELIYDKIPWIQNIESPYPNLILRTIIFGLILILIKKFNL